jgi:hypothetical protein
MTDIDDSFIKTNSIATELPVQQSVLKEKIYRVSWIVEGKRKEEFFKNRQWAETFCRKLVLAAELLKTNIDPMVGELTLGEEK